MSLIEPKDSKPEKQVLTDEELAEALKELALKASSTEVSLFILEVVEKLQARMLSEVASMTPGELLRTDVCSSPGCEELFFWECVYCHHGYCRAHSDVHGCPNDRSVLGDAYHRD